LNHYLNITKKDFILHFSLLRAEQLELAVFQGFGEQTEVG
jgi:hypothetical protein